MTAAIFLAILLVDLLAAMSPGPTFLVAVRTAAVEGFRPAAGYAAGVGIASAVWASAALFGLAAVFQLAPALFMLLKVAGGGFWSGSPSRPGAMPTRRSPRRRPVPCRGPCRPPSGSAF